MTRAGLVLVLAACGCGPGDAIVVVTASHLPKGAASLQAAAVLGTSPGNEMPNFELGAIAGMEQASFGLDLPAGSEGTLSLAVRALDGRGCTLALGDQRADVGAQQTQLTVALEPLPVPDCRGVVPAILGVTPGVAEQAGGEHLTIRGWGLLAGASISIDGVDAGPVTWDSPARLRVVAPAQRAGRPFCRVALQVKNPDGSSDSRDDEMSYDHAAGPLRLECAPGTPIALDTGAISLAMADLDQDGWPDLAVSILGPDTIRCGHAVDQFFNQKAAPGTFVRAADANTAPCPYSLGLADLNLDGFPDLVVVSNGNSGDAAVHLNTHGSFPYFGLYPVGGNPSSVALGDLNKDGYPDMVVASGAAGNVGVFLNQGLMNGVQNTTDPQAIFPAAGTLYGVSATPKPNPQAVGIADVNGDRAPDLVTANYAAGTVAVLLNGGSGTFLAMGNPEYMAGKSPIALAIGDLNKDNLPDLVVANDFANTINVLLNQGGGTFSQRNEYPVGTDPVSVAIGDLDGDGQPDLVVANNQVGEGTINVLLNQGGGKFPADGGISFPAPPGPSSVVIGDVDGDGRPDIVVASFGSYDGGLPGGLSVFLNRAAAVKPSAPHPAAAAAPPATPPGRRTKAPARSPAHRR